MLVAKKKQNIVYCINKNVPESLRDTGIQEDSGFLPCSIVSPFLRHEQGRKPECSPIPGTEVTGLWYVFVDTIFCFSLATSTLSIAIKGQACCCFDSGWSGSSLRNFSTGRGYFIQFTWGNFDSMPKNLLNCLKGFPTCLKGFVDI